MRVGAVVLAAGSGTRLNDGQPSDKPKVLYQLNGKPMVEYTVELLKQIGIEEIVMVVGYKEEMVQDYFGNQVKYASQPERLGTAHAARIGIDRLNSSIAQVLIIQGDDSAFYKPETIRKFIESCGSKKLGFTSVKLADPGQYGRIIRDEKNDVIAIIEKESLNEDQKKINEVNAATYFVDRNWFDQAYLKLTPSAVGKGELILPDLVEIAVSENEKVIGFLVDQSEWVGINTPEELEKADSLKKEN